MQRRHFLFGTAAMSIAQFFPSPSWSADETTLIDAHCHIFNADDLPVAQFLEKVVIKSNKDFEAYRTRYGNAIQFLVRYASDWINTVAPDAKSELNRLQATPNQSQPRTAAEIEHDEIKHLTKLIEQLKSLRIKSRNFTFREQLVSSYLPGAIMAQMHREAYPLQFSADDLISNADGAHDPNQWVENSEEIAKRIYREADGPLSRYLKWALLLTRHRSELANELANTHGGNAMLATPALIDFSNWLDDSFNVQIPQQIDLMEQISIRRARMKLSPRIHALAPFCPLRQILYADGKTGGYNQSPLDLVKQAINERGFVGVKLYPPMGFRPSGNAGTLFYQNFPKHLDQAFRRKLPQRLDASLNELYAWCAAENVPILAHASDSNGSDIGYSSRANPDNWAAVLRTHPKLRLLLAHFGDFDEGFVTKERPRPRLSETWEWRMAKLTQDFSGSPVYLDASYFLSAMLGADHGKRREIRRMMREVFARFPLARQRIVFGSDWVMLGQEELFQSNKKKGQYAKSILGFLGNEIAFETPALSAFAQGNAVAWLGLTLPNNQNNNRSRLITFYGKHKLDRSWLNQLQV